MLFASLFSPGLIPVQQREVLGCITKVPNPIYQGDYLVTNVGALMFSCESHLPRPCEVTYVRRKAQ